MSQQKQALVTILFGAAFTTLGYGLLKLLEPRQVVLEHPTGPDPRVTPPGPPPPSGPTRLGGPVIEVHPGRAYAAAVEVSAPLSWLASASKVQAFAQKEGFSNVRVTEEVPPGFPSNTEADYYVTGVYSAPNPKAFYREQAKGQVTLADTWQV